jgi:hypothetical protein
MFNEGGNEQKIEMMMMMSSTRCDTTRPVNSLFFVDKISAQ